MTDESKLPREIRADEVKVGQTIRVEWNFPDQHYGETRTGVVQDVMDHGHLHRVTFTNARSVMLEPVSATQRVELLAEPEPPAPTYPDGTIAWIRGPDPFWGHERLMVFSAGLWRLGTVGWMPESVEVVRVVRVVPDGHITIPRDTLTPEGVRSIADKSNFAGSVWHALHEIADALETQP